MATTICVSALFSNNISFPTCLQGMWRTYMKCNKLKNILFVIYYVYNYLRVHTMNEQKDTLQGNGQ